MDPVPKMVIPTQLARRKGEVEVSSVEEVDELISQLIIAKTGLLGAASAIGAKGAMEAAREVEAGRDGDGGVLFPAGPDDDEPADVDDAAPCPSCGKSGRHAPLCARKAQLAELGERITALSEPADEPVLWKCTYCETEFETLPSATPPVCPTCGPPAGHTSRGPWEDQAHREAMATLSAGGHTNKGLAAPLASVTPMRPAAGDDPCPEVHPDKGTPCIGTDRHGPPCRDLDGYEWVPPLAGAL